MGCVGSATAACGLRLLAGFHDFNIKNERVRNECVAMPWASRQAGSVGSWWMVPVGSDEGKRVPGSKCDGGRSGRLAMKTDSGDSMRISLAEMRSQTIRRTSSSAASRGT